jgi:formylglycine-generating enzyme required for sulfatase activity
VRAEEHQRGRFSEILAQSIAGPRLYLLMSLRADFFGELQKDEPLYGAHHQINVPPLREVELQEVVSRPAALLCARFETDHLAADIARRTAEESTKDAGALPLLSYILDDMWRCMIQKDDGILRLPPQSIDLGSVLVDRARAFISNHPNSEHKLRRIFTLKLATVREDGEPTRRRAWRSEFSDEEWRLVTELADHPNRLLITAIPEVTATLGLESSCVDQRVALTAREIYAEVAHEAIFRRWDNLRDWVAAEREFLAWRSGLEAARRRWERTPERSKADALLMGLALAQAQSWLARRPDDLPEVDRQFILLSRAGAQRRIRRVRARFGVLAFGTLLGLIAWLNETYWQEPWRWYSTIRPYMLRQVRPYVLTVEAERALKPRDSFRECAKGCPQMVVVPAGEFMMGSPANEKGRDGAEGPQHNVLIAHPFAVSRFDVTFEEWDACAAYGDCDPHMMDAGWGRGRQPVINVTWDDAQRYVAWLSRMTGKPYRLLSEAEWAYAARAGTSTPYPWGPEIGNRNANCNHCGSQWDSKRPAPVGSFAPNQFGLYDMHGNVWQWSRIATKPTTTELLQTAPLGRPGSAIAE